MINSGYYPNLVMIVQVQSYTQVYQLVYFNTFSSVWGGGEGSQTAICPHFSVFLKPLREPILQHFRTSTSPLCPVRASQSAPRAPKPHSPGYHSAFSTQGSFPCSNREITAGLEMASPAQRNRILKICRPKPTVT